MNDRLARDLGARPGACSAACASTGARPQAVPDARRTSPRLPGRVRRPAAIACRRAAPPATPGACRLPPRARIDGYALTGTALALRGTPLSRRRHRSERASTAAGSRSTCSRGYGVALAARGPRSISGGEIGRGRRIWRPATSSSSRPPRRTDARRRSRSAATSSCTRRVRPAWCASSDLSSSYWSPRFLGARRIGT